MLASQHTDQSWLVCYRNPWRAIAIAALAIVAGCTKAPQSAAPPSRPPTVVLTTPVVKTITDYEDFTGHTEAVATVEVRARVTGYLDKVLFKEGTEVKQGEPLFEIDPRSYRTDLDRAAANVLQSRARVRRLEADFKRASSLLQTRAMSQEDFDKVAGERDEAAAALKLAEAAEELAKLNLSFTHVAAPLSGRISRQLIDPGNLVRADDTMLATIVSHDPIYAYFDADERTTLRVRRLIRAGKVKSIWEAKVPVYLALVDEDDYPHVGTVNFVDNRMDPLTGTIRLRGVFDNPQRLLPPGLFVRIRLPIGVPHESLLLSERALGSNQGQKFVYVVDDANKVSERRVEVGALHDGLRVIASGLKANERVVLDGLQQVRPGMTVTPQTTAALGADKPEAAKNK